jgi:Thioredoxin-like
MIRVPFRWTLILCGCLLAATPVVRAQEPGIKWRTDYTAARKESETKNLPLFIDFIRPNCPPCLKMEQYTFSDPRVIKTLNERYIPLRINGVEETQLASHLRITLFPTIVLASPEGRIVSDPPLIGFQEPEVLHERLQRVLATLYPNDAAKGELENAAKWEASGEYARAITVLRNILDDQKAISLHRNAQDLLQKIEKRGDEHLMRAKEMNARGQTLEALESLTDVRRQFLGVKASKDAGEMIATLIQGNSQLKLEQRSKRVRELLAQAQDFYKTRDYIPCLDRCEIIISTYGDLPEGQQAFMLSSEIKNNPEWLQAAADVMTDRLGGIYLALADSYLKRGDTTRARFYLERVVQAFPGSRMAESAQIRLSQLQPAAPTRADNQP